ncbi:MAG: LPS-assembly protein LptD [Limisphaerales bacterium]
MRAALHPAALALATASSALAADGGPDSPPPTPPAEDAIRIQSLTPGFQGEFDLQTGNIAFANGVLVTYGDTTLTAQRMQVNPNTREALAEGGVQLRRGAAIWFGDRLEYNFDTRAAAAKNLVVGNGNLFLRADELATTSVSGTNVTYSLGNAFLTTDDVEQPGYRVRAQSMTLTEDRVSADNATLLVGNLPVLWFPSYSRQLEQHRVYSVHLPGYRSRYGAYLLNSLFFPVTPGVQGSVALDGYARRGVGLGAGLTYDLPHFGTGLAQGYYISDGEEPVDPNTGETVDSDRYRVRFEHAVSLRPELTAKAAVRYWSDLYVERDFFESQYRENVQPQTFLEVQQQWENFTLNAVASPRVNDFFETVERLPDVRLRGLRQQIGSSPLYYESDNSLAYLRRQFAYDTQPDYEAFRADTMQQVLLPQTLFGWLHVTPRAAGRFTHYGETDGLELEEQSRWVFNTGAEVSARASRTWSNAENRFWAVNGLRHIVEPSVNYAYTPAPDANPLELPQFDRLVPSLRPLPISFPDYHAIDSVDAQNVLRFGLRNQLQTRRDDGIADLVDWALLMDWRVDPDEEQDQDDFGDLYNELDFQPRDWLLVTSEVRFDPNDGVLVEAATYATLLPGDSWSFAFGHRYLDGDLFGGIGDNLVTTRVTWKLSNNWAFRMSHAVEMEDGVLEEQYYTLYRDLRSFTVALTARLRDSRDAEPDDFTIGFSISLKAFPRFGRGEDSERPEVLIGG